MIWHSCDIEDIKKELNFDEKQGLSGKEVAERIQQYGENRAVVKKERVFAKEFSKRLFGKENIGLIALALVLIVTGLIGNKPVWYAPFSVILVVVLSAVCGALFALHNDKLVKNLNNKISLSAKVLREGNQVKIDASLLVPGDVIFLEAGDYIPADGRLLEENSLICDESAISGDSAPTEKDVNALPDDICLITERYNMVYAGCSVTYGRGVAVVTDTGKNTELGKQSLLNEQTVGTQTQVKKTLTSFGKTVGIASLISSVIILFLCIIFVPSTSFSDHVFEAITLGLSVYAICFSKALPRCFTSAISFACSGMETRNAVVVNPETVETLGKTSVIISDKTGTLTRNKMKMATIWCSGKLTDLYTDKPDENEITLIRTGAMCCNGKIALGASGKDRHIGDPTEIAIVSACREYCGLSKDELENVYPRMAEISFDSKRKLMTTVNMINNRPFAIVKGAPDILLSLCTGGDLKAASEASFNMGNAGQRVIGVAIKPLENVPSNPNSQELECDLTLLGMFGMTDYISHSTRNSLEMCSQAGIEVVMVTGDHITTAVAIAKQLGILKKGQKAITGDELEAMPDEQLREEIKNISVYSRISDTQKIRIVSAWQETGETVALTGDSVEDAAALKQADVGLAMGITGTDIAKGNADVILTDDSFIAAVNAIKTSRSAFYNIRHAVGLYLATVIAEVVALIFGIAIFKSVIIPTGALAFVNLLLIMLLSRALTAEADRKNSMKIPPIGKKEGLFSRIPHFDFIWQGVLLGILALVGYGVLETPAVSFAVLSFGLVFLALGRKNCKDVLSEGVSISKNMLLGLVVAFVISLLVIFTPLSVLFSLEAVNGAVFGIALAFGLVILILTELVKLIFRIKKY